MNGVTTREARRSEGMTMAKAKAKARRRRWSCGFYDLNIRGDGVEMVALRGTVGMALQLGFSGVAQSHVARGGMADGDACRLRAFDADALVEPAQPELAHSIQFHRDLLGFPPSQPFRQYSRLTAVVDNPLHASALNASNPILRSYDLVAVWPTNQKAFEQACSHLEVDIISLDLCHRLPFRLKPPNIKAAVERGVHFEINYSQTLSDLKARTEVFSNGQMLQGLTRGRNIIISSGARTLMDLRGPNDIANMATMFGLSREAAKAAVSTNCRAVILHGLARKKTYKGAIAIDYCPPDGINSSHEAWFDVPKGWDPLSNGCACDFIPVSQTAEIGLVFSNSTDNNIGEEKNSEDPKVHHDVTKKKDSQSEKSVDSNDLNMENHERRTKTFRKDSKRTQRKRKRYL